MSDHEPSRLEMELELIQSMYPGQADYASKAREFKFTVDRASLQLRLPETYPESGLPDVIAAHDASKSDVRTITSATVKGLDLADGEEALDAIIAAFQQVLEDNSVYQQASDAKSSARDHHDISKTVIIWLHHLLALTKRKLALSPTSLSGMAKPGYPGVMIFSGPASAVNDHVNTLKAENWQAFQVRYEEEEKWSFAHGKGVKEMETMAEVVKGLQLADGNKEEVSRGEKQKEQFLKAVGIK